MECFGLVLTENGKCYCFFHQLQANTKVTILRSTKSCKEINALRLLGTQLWDFLVFSFLNSGAPPTVRFFFFGLIQYTNIVQFVHIHHVYLFASQRIETAHDTFGAVKFTDKVINAIS